jgi:hypothetical protein
MDISKYRKLAIAVVIDGVRMEQWVSATPTAGNPDRKWRSEDGRIVVGEANWRGTIWRATVDGNVMPKQYRNYNTAMKAGVAALKVGA